MIAGRVGQATALGSGVRAGVRQASLARSRVGSPRRAVVAMAAQPAFEAWVKGDPEKKVLGDCPFCHRALLTLEEKHVPYEKNYVDFANKPDWLFKINEKGSVPAIKDLQADKWITDSAEFVDYLEEKVPQPALGKADSAPDPGSGLFPAFVKLLKAGGGEEAQLRDSFLGELRALSQHLQAGGGPFLRGRDVSAGDLALGPKLYHALTALKHFKGFELPADAKPVGDYLAALQARESWKNTFYGEDLVIRGWQAHLDG